MPKPTTFNVTTKDLRPAITKLGAEQIVGLLSELQAEQDNAGYRAIAANGALVISEDDTVIKLSSTDAATKAATMTATYAGHRIRVRLDVRSSTGSYTLAAKQGGTAGTVTLDAAAEVADLVYNGSAWEVELLSGATWA